MTLCILLLVFHHSKTSVSIMDVIVIFNGLGNQMSQYAFYLKKKSLRSNTAFITFCSDHNGLELENLFKINCKHNFKKKYFM